MFSIKVKSIETLLFFISAALVPMYFTDFRFPTGGVIIRLSDLMAIFVILSFSFLFLRGRVKISYPIGVNYILFFLMYCFFNALIQSGLFKALVATLQWVMILFSLVIVYSNAVTNPEKFKKIFIITLLIICFFTVLYHVLNGHYTRYKNLGDARYSFALAGVVLLSCCFYYSERKFLKYLVVLYPVIILSMERKGILVFHIVFVFYMLYILKPLYRYFLTAAIAFFVLIFILFFDLSFLTNISVFEYSELEMLYLDEEQAFWVSNLHRQSLLENGWDIFSNNYVFGVGPKMLQSYMMNYYIHPSLGLYTHNVFLDTLVEQGAIGLFLLLLPYFIFYKNIIRRAESKEKMIFFGLCMYSFFMLFFMSGGAPSMLLFYFPIFMGFVIHKK